MGPIFSSKSLEFAVWGRTMVDPDLKKLKFMRFQIDSGVYHCI